MKKILILGAGALGSNIAAHLVADFRDKIELTVLDFDKVEERNVQAGTQFFMPDQIGQNKVDALQYNIYKWFGKEIQTWNKKFGESFSTTANLAETLSLSNYYLIIDCFDNYNARGHIQADWFDFDPKTFSLLHCGFSPKMTFEISWAENYEVPEDSLKPVDICEMQGAASFIKMVTGLASSTIGDYLITGRKKYFVGNRFSFHEIV